MIKAWIDGACEPINPGGTASYGLVVKEGFLKLFEKSAIVASGRGMSNNVAEYSALIAFLEWYKEQKLNRPAMVYSDSQLLTNQMSGFWSVRGGLYVPYYERAIALLKPTISFKWIPREQNEEADKLSKDALIAHGIRVRER